MKILRRTSVERPDGMSSPTADAAAETSVVIAAAFRRYPLTTLSGACLLPVTVAAAGDAYTVAEQAFRADRPELAGAVLVPATRTAWRKGRRRAQRDGDETR